MPSLTPAHQPQPTPHCYSPCTPTPLPQRVPGSDDAIALALLTSAGTYVKEFVHGDGGRTEPSVGTLLGCQADIETLDVLEIVMEWL